jgi:hypothetical protein
MKKTRQVLEAASRLQSSEFTPLVNWLKASRLETMELLTTAPENSLRLLQGKAQCFEEILNLIEQAREGLDKMGDRNGSK